MGIFFLLFLILSNHPSLSTRSSTKIDYENEITPVSTIAPPPPPPPAAAVGIKTTPFNSTIAVIVGILTTMFLITFLSLLYFKHCKSETYPNISRGHGYPPTSRINSGINRKVIESLPMFRFSSLRGQKDGLECAVCLNKFEPDEVLRLLPKCKHAFHVECVDTWLDGHSTCPLCRYRVDPEDVLLIDCKSMYYNHSHLNTPRNSDQGNRKVPARISGRHSYAAGSSLEIIKVEKPGQDFRGRVSLDSWNSRTKTERFDFKSKLLESVGDKDKKSGQSEEKPGRKDGQLPVVGNKRRLDHRIVIGPEAAEGRRWSDAQAVELLYLSGRGVINGRSVSEITGVSRYNKDRGSNNGGEEGVVKRWLAWIAQSQHNHNHKHPAVVEEEDTAISTSAILH